MTFRNKFSFLIHIISFTLIHCLFECLETLIEFAKVSIGKHNDDRKNSEKKKRNRTNSGALLMMATV